MAVPGQGELPVGAVMAKLVDVGVGLVGDAFAVTIDVHAAEARRLHGVFAEFPDIVEDRVTRTKLRDAIVERIVDADLADRVRFEPGWGPDDFTVAEGEHFTDFGRHWDGVGPRVPFVRWDDDPVGMRSCLKNHRDLTIANRGAGLSVDGLVRPGLLAQVDLESRAFFRDAGLEGYRTERGLPKVVEEMSRRLAHHVIRCNLCLHQWVARRGVPVRLRLVEVAGPEGLRLRPFARRANAVPRADGPGVRMA